MSINGLSFMSARPAQQPVFMSVFMVRGIQEITIPQPLNFKTDHSSFSSLSEVKSNFQKE